MAKSCNKELKKITQNIKGVLELLIDNNTMIKDLINDFDNQTLKEVKKEFNKNSLSQLASKLDSKIIEALSCDELRKKDANELVSYLKSTNEVIKIASNTREVLTKLESNNKALEDKEIKKLSSKMYTNIVKVLNICNTMIDLDNADDIMDVYDQIVILEDKIDSIYEQINKYILTSKNKNINTDILKVLRKSEKIANRALSIANLLRFPYQLKQQKK